MSCSFHHEGAITNIELSGRFVFDVHKPFREAYEAANQRPETKVVQVDLSGVNYLDSSALGMMLLMKERVEMAGKKPLIKGPSDFVCAILKTANFDKLFEIQHT